MAIKTGQGGEMTIVLRVKDDGTAVIDKFGKTSEDSAKKSSKAFGDFTSGAGINFRSVALYAGIAAAGAVGIGIAMVKSQIDIANATGDTAEKLGTTAEAVSALNYVASLSNVSAQELAQSLHFMNRNLADAAKNTGEARFAIKDLGLNAQELKDLKPEDAMLAIAGALEKIPSQADRAALAADVFNDRTGKMLLVLKGGPDAIRANIAEAERFGKIMGTDTVEAAKELDKNITRLKANLEGLAIKVMPAVVNSLNVLAEALLGPDPYDVLLRRRTAIADKLASLNPLSLGGADVTDFRRGLETELKQVDALIVAQAKKFSDAAAARAAAAGGPGGRDSRAEEEAAKKLAQEQKELAKEILQIHRDTLSEQIRLAEEFVEKDQRLARARAIGVIQSDRELNERRLELATKFEADLLALALKDPELVARQERAQQLGQERAAREAELAARVEDLRASVATETQVEADRYAQQIAALFEANQTMVQIDADGNVQRLIADEEFNALREQFKTEHERRVSEIEGAELAKRYGQAGTFAASMMKLWKQGASGQIQVAQSLFGELAGLMQSRHKTMFEIGKKAALAEAAISMYQSIQAALATKPFFPLGLAMGAIATVKGLGNIQAIQATQFGGANATGTFAASPSSGLPSGGLSGTGGPSTVPAPLAPEAPPRTLTLILSGTDVYSAANVRDKLVPVLNEAQRDGAYRIEVRMVA
jgi:hypothetical protein